MPKHDHLMHDDQTILLALAGDRLGGFSWTEQAFDCAPWNDRVSIPLVVLLRPDMAGIARAFTTLRGEKIGEMGMSERWQTCARAARLAWKPEAQRP